MMGGHNLGCYLTMQHLSTSKKQSSTLAEAPFFSSLLCLLYKSVANLINDLFAKLLWKMFQLSWYELCIKAAAWDADYRHENMDTRPMVISST